MRTCRASWASVLFAGGQGGGGARRLRSKQREHSGSANGKQTARMREAQRGVSVRARSAYRCREARDRLGRASRHRASAAARSTQANRGTRRTQRAAARVALSVGRARQRRRPHTSIAVRMTATGGMRLMRIDTAWNRLGSSSCTISCAAQQPIGRAAWSARSACRCGMQRAPRVLPCTCNVKCSVGSQRS